MKPSKRKVLLLGLLLTLGVVWSTASVVSPVEGWVGETAISAWKALLRVTASPPCTSEELAIAECGHIKIPYPDCWNAHFLDRRDGDGVCDPEDVAESFFVLFLFGDPESRVAIGAFLASYGESRDPERVREIYRRGSELSTNGWYLLRENELGLPVTSFYGEDVYVRFAAEVPDYLAGTASEVAVAQSLEQMISAFLEMNDASEPLLQSE